MSRHLVTWGVTLAVWIVVVLFALFVGAQFNNEDLGFVVTLVLSSFGGWMVGTVWLGPRLFD